MGASTALQSDEQLVARAKGGDLEAFEELTTRHERQVFTVAQRIVQQQQDAEDVTQQSFLSALRHLDKFRGESSFSTWLLRITTYAALKVLRSRKTAQSVSLDAATEAADEEGRIPHPEYIADWRKGPDLLAQDRETSAFLDRALKALDDKHRLVFLLRDVEGLSVRETAEALGISEGNVKVRLLRARLQLREQLTKAFGDPSKRVEPGHHHP